MGRELSLDKSMKAGENFTLLDMLASKQEEFPSCSTSVKVKIRQARRSIEIDNDVVEALRSRYGLMPLGRAIRTLLGLRPKVSQTAWQEEEDALIRDHFPLRGAPPIAEVLGRSADCVRERASKLGIKRKWLYKRDRRADSPQSKSRGLAPEVKE